MSAGDFFENHAISGRRGQDILVRPDASCYNEVRGGMDEKRTSAVRLKKFPEVKI